MSEPSFAGNKRYSPTRVLGAGSWGRVYQAYDAERNAFVAVKLLQRASPDSLMRFKREFRSLQDLVHPNLVTLYELMSDGDQWFFTMELVDGKNFLEHVRGAPVAGPAGGGVSSSGAPTINERAPAPQLNATTATVEQPKGGDTAALANAPPAKKRPPPSPELIARLRDALGQLADGLSALHAAGKLHRDVKPSNVLVAKDGRVVLLDFGLVHELSEVDEKLAKGLVVGTPAYMSPEQAGGMQLDEASDWYAVGVLLFEALTGQVPFEGPTTQMLKARRTQDPGPPSAYTEGVPADLDALCYALLAREPWQRPKGHELLARLQRPGPKARPPAAPHLFGRDAELDALRSAHRWVRERKAPALVSVEAPPSLGKSALVDAFLAEVKRTDPMALVLYAQCGERESVPFKAFDGAIDALVSQLGALPLAALRPLMPRDVRSLMRLFPVAKRLEPAVPPEAAQVPADPLEIRRRGFAALRQLLLVLAKQRTVVVALDDLQFSDEDSAALLAKVLDSPALPPVLVVAAFESRAREPEGAVRAFEDAAFAAAGARNVQLTRLVLAPLQQQTARALALAHGAPEAQLEAVVREAEGNPLLVARLSALAEEGKSTLAEWAAAHLAALAPPARRLLEVVAVAQRPVDRLVAWHAAKLDAEAADPSMQLLASRLLASDGARLVPYQRELGRAVRDALPEAERSRLLLALADALAAAPEGDFEAVADWAAEAGQVLRASVAAEKAAEKAEAVLAFDRAARLYERALKGRAPEDVDRLQRRRAAALAGAGRGKAAAAVYLQAAATAPREEAIPLRLRAGEQLLYSGHIDAGLAVMSEVLIALGSAVPKAGEAGTPLAPRSRVELERIEVKPKEAWEAGALLRTDAFWAAAKGFSLVDPALGASFQAAHFRHALECGDPYRIARALALEAGFHGLVGLAHRDACLAALERLSAVLRDHPSDHAEGLAALMTGCAALGSGQLREAARHFEYAVSLLEEKRPDLAWEITSSQQYLAWAWFNLGEYARVKQQVEAVREQAQARGDAYALTNFRVRVGGLVRLVEGDAHGALNEIGAALQGFSKAGYFAQHLWGYFGEIAALLYEGRHAEAVAREKAEWPKIRESGMLRIQLTRVLVGYLRGQLAVLDPTLPSHEAAKLGRLLEGEGLGWATGLARLLHGAAAARDGQTAQALEQLDEGARLLEAAGAVTHAVAARRAAGQLRGALVQSDEAEAWLRERGVREPEKFARAFFTLR